MSNENKFTPGPCHWNGNEICQDCEPKRGVAGLAPDAPEEWGRVFAAAPELLEALQMICDSGVSLADEIEKKMLAAITKATS